jgi:hypothetical protein
MATLKLGTTTAITETSGKLTLGTPLGLTFASIQTFSASGTWTPTDSNVSAVYVIVTGGGGGGGHYATLNQDSGGGGQGGGTSIKWITSGLGSTEVVTIGAAGVKPTSNVTGGGGSPHDGGTSSFGSHCSATGGECGHYADNGGSMTLPGVGIGGDINLYGGCGIPAMDTTTGWGTPGNGGASYWDGGGVGASYQAGGALVGHHGSGGGGGYSYQSQAGANGGAGFIVVYEYKG